MEDNKLKEYVVALDNGSHPVMYIFSPETNEYSDWDEPKENHMSCIKTHQDIMKYSIKSRHEFYLLVAHFEDLEIFTVFA